MTKFQAFAKLFLILWDFETNPKHWTIYNMTKIEAVAKRFLNLWDEAAGATQTGIKVSTLKLLFSGRRGFKTEDISNGSDFMWWLFENLQFFRAIIFWKFAIFSCDHYLKICNFSCDHYWKICNFSCDHFLKICYFLCHHYLKICNFFVPSLFENLLERELC